MEYFHQQASQTHKQHERLMPRGEKIAFQILLRRLSDIDLYIRSSNQFIFMRMKFNKCMIKKIIRS